jgi:hypothetical protein
VSVRISHIASLALLIAASTAPALASARHDSASAILTDPKTHAYVGTFTENCSKSPVAVNVFLAPARAIQGTEWIGIEPGSSGTPSAFVSAQNEWISVSSFGGMNPAGCIPVGMSVVLIYSPGGLLGNTLQVLLAEGVVSAS